MTEEELNQLKAITYEAAWRGARDGSIGAAILIAISAILIAIFIWLIFYGGLSLIMKLTVTLILIIAAVTSGFPQGTFTFLASIVFGIFVLAILWSIGKECYVAKRSRTTSVNSDKLQTWREYK